MKLKLLAFTSLAALSFILLISTGKNYSSSNNWQKVIDKSYNAVVQVAVHGAEFNWKEPYKAPEQKQGAGTGFFINKEGYLLTNYHVVDQAKSIQVYIEGLGKNGIEANIVGVCPEADIALIKISESGINLIKQNLGNISYLESGNSDNLYHTQNVLVMGYPLGLKYIKSTTGVIAGKEWIHATSYIQVTAPINPGNSGGPLLNEDGKVVGINTAGMPDFQNICYIIPINDVKVLLQNLYETKLIRRPNYGLYCNTTTNEHAKLLKAPTPTGIFVNDVIKGSIADKAGIRPNDIIYKINGHLIDQYGDVTVELKSTTRISLEEFFISLPLKTKLSITVYRDGKEIVLDKAIVEQTELKPIRTVFPDYESHEIDYEMFGGFCVMQLRSNHLKVLPYTYSMQKYSNPDMNSKQVLIITKILPGSYLDRIKCFYEGAILDIVNGEKVNTLSDLRKTLLKSADSGYIEISTEDKISSVISVDKILEDEERLSRAFMFNISDTLKKLAQLRNQTQKNS